MLELLVAQWMLSSAIHGLGQFTLKALIIIGLNAGAFVLAAALVAPRIERVVENTEAKMLQYTKLGGAQF